VLSQAHIDQERDTISRDQKKTPGRLPEGGREKKRTPTSRKTSWVGVISWLDTQVRQRLLANPIAIAYHHSRCPVIVNRLSEQAAEIPGCGLRPRIDYLVWNYRDINHGLIGVVQFFIASPHTAARHAVLP